METMSAPAAGRLGGTVAKSGTGASRECLLQPGRRREFTADASLMAVSLVWGSTFIIVQRAIAQVPAFAFLTLRFGVAFALLAALCFHRRDRLTPGAVRDGACLGTALFLAFATQTLGLKTTSASVTAFITGLYVVIVPLMSALLLRRRPRRSSLAGVGLSLAGLALMTLDGPTASFSRGEILVLASAVFCSAHILLTDVYSRRHDPLTLTTIQIGTMLVLAMAVSLPLEPYTVPETWSGSLITAVLLTGVLATVLGFLVQTGMQRHTTPTKASLIYMLEPVSALFFNYLVAGEILSGRKATGAALVLAAMILAEIGPRFRRE